MESVSDSVQATTQPGTDNSASALEARGPVTQHRTPADDPAQAQRLRRERAFEVASAVALAVVAVATAWSGYQATRWTDAQSARYAQASAQRVQATRDATLAGQLRIYDEVLVNNWLNAHSSG